jgi:hypothetical protein
MAFSLLRIKKRYFVSLIGSIVLLALLTPSPVFMVIDENTNIKVYSGLVASGDQFKILYIHSVERMDVTGIFRINDHYNIEPLETIFPSYGAGMPSMVGKENLIYERGMMRVKHHDIVLKNLRIFISHIARQKILLKKDQVDLYTKMEDGGIAVITVKRRPLVMTFF